MTVPITALGVGPLRWKDIILTAAAPTVGDINTYNTLTVAAPLNITLPQLNPGGTAGGVMLLGKDVNDGSTNALTFTTFAGETFADLTTTLILVNGGQSRLLQVVNVLGILKWCITGGLGTPDLLSVSTAQSALPMIIALG